MTTAPAWTDDRVEQLKTLWESGLSASQIAAELGDVTRNAVIGKVHRLGMAGRPKNSVGGKPRSRKANPRPEPVLRMRARSIKQAFEDAAEERAEEIAEEVAIPTAHSVGLLDLTDAVCHWPHGDPLQPDFHFCGGKALAGAPYCAHHCRIAYQPTSDRRRSATYEISDAERARRADLGKRMAARAHAKRMGVE